MVEFLRNIEAAWQNSFLKKKYTYLEKCKKA